MKNIKNKKVFNRKILSGVIIFLSLFISIFILQKEVHGYHVVECVKLDDRWDCPACDIPNVPSVTAGDTGETSMAGTISSTADNSDYCATYFKLYRGADFLKNVTAVCHGTYADGDYSDTGLYPGTTYTYKAKACQDDCTICGPTVNECKALADRCSDYSSNASDDTAFYAPTGITSQCYLEGGDNKAYITWADNSSAESGYKIERNPDAGSFSEINSVGANSTSYIDSGLSENHWYGYRVRAYHSSGSYSGYTGESWCLTAIKPPTGLSASAVSSTQINLSWTDNSSVEDGYKIERATGACSGTPSFSQIATTAANAQSYSDTGLLNGTTYCYKVRAYWGGNYSAYSNTDSDTTTMPAPTNLSGTAISQTQIDLIWTDNSNSETGFKIERADNSDCSGTPSFSQIATVDSNITSYSNTGLTSNTSYCYRVRAYTSYADSAYSATVAVSTSLPSPTNLTATASSTSTTQVNLTWTDNSDNEDEFRLERKTGSSGTYAQIASVATNTTAYANIGVLDGTVYYYRARACNTAACSSYSNEAFATTTLVAPTNLTCAPISSSQIDLGWTDNSASETGFKIERATSSPPTTVIFTTGQNAVAYSNINLSENTTYYYRIRAYNANSGVYSSYTSICSTSTPIYAPTGNVTSSIFDTSAANGVAFNNILWKGAQPSDSHVLFHFASSNSTTSFNFIGPNGTSATYYQASGANIAMNISTRYHNNHRYFRYKVYIYPNGSNQSPQITDIIIGYSP